MAINDNLKISKSYLHFLCKMAYKTGKHRPIINYSKSQVYKHIEKMLTTEDILRKLLSPSRTLKQTPMKHLTGGQTKLNLEKFTGEYLNHADIHWNGILKD